MSERYQTENLTFNLGVLGEDVEFIVVYSYYPGYGGSREEPPEPEELDIEGIYTTDTSFTSLKYDLFKADKLEVVGVLNTIYPDLGAELMSDAEKRIQAMIDAGPEYDGP